MHKIYITLTLVAGFILALGFQHNKIANLELTIATLKTEIATANANAALERTAKEVEIQQIKDSTYDQVQELQEQLVVISDGRDALIERLRNVPKTTHSCTTQTAASSERGPSKQDQTTFDLFIGMLDRHTKELEEIGGYADKLRIAGLACESISDKWAE